MTLREESRQRKEEVRERIRASREARREAKADCMREEQRIKAKWHIDTAQRTLEYCSRMVERYEKRAAELEYKVSYFESVGLPHAGIEAKMLKAQDDLFKQQERVSKAELELAVWTHRLENIDLF